jgi:large conductance mechanosensitive channel
MGMMQEFKEFINKGNVLDLAVGVIIGGAFGKIVDSIVNDLINPIIGKLIGQPDFSAFMIPLSEIPAELVGKGYADIAKAIPVIGIGQFITVIFNFLILAFIIFQIVKMANRFKKEEAPAAPPAPPEDLVVLKEIRDALKAR